jgi:hypothetical protein
MPFSPAAFHASLLSVGAARKRLLRSEAACRALSSVFNLISGMKLASQFAFHFRSSLR